MGCHQSTSTRKEEEEVVNKSSPQKDSDDSAAVVCDQQQQQRLVSFRVVNPKYRSDCASFAAFEEEEGQRTPLETSATEEPKSPFLPKPEEGELLHQHVLEVENISSSSRSDSDVSEVNCVNHRSSEPHNEEEKERTRSESSAGGMTLSVISALEESVSSICSPRGASSPSSGMPSSAANRNMEAEQFEEEEDRTTKELQQRREVILNALRDNHRKQMELRHQLHNVLSAGQNKEAQHREEAAGGGEPKGPSEASPEPAVVHSPRSLAIHRTNTLLSFLEESRKNRELKRRESSLRPLFSCPNRAESPLWKEPPDQQSHHHHHHQQQQQQEAAEIVHEIKWVESVQFDSLPSSRPSTPPSPATEQANAPTPYPQKERAYPGPTSLPTPSSASPGCMSLPSPTASTMALRETTEVLGSSQKLREQRSRSWSGGGGSTTSANPIETARLLSFTTSSPAAAAAKAQRSTPVKTTAASPQQTPQEEHRHRSQSLISSSEKSRSERMDARRTFWEQLKKKK